MKRKGATKGAPASMGDLANIAEIWTTYRPRLELMLRLRMDRSLRRHVDPDDILADVYVKLSQCGEDLNGSEDQFALVYRIAYQHYIDVYRHYHRHKRDVRADVPLPDHSSVQIALKLFDSEKSPGSAAAYQELYEKVRTAMKLLPPVDQELLHLIYLEQFSTAEAAAVLAISPGAVAQRCLRAARKLRRICQGLIS